MQAVIQQLVEDAILEDVSVGCYIREYTFCHLLAKTALPENDNATLPCQEQHYDAAQHHCVCKDRNVSTMKQTSPPILNEKIPCNLHSHSDHLDEVAEVV